jgi:hypothetical protein
MRLPCLIILFCAACFGQAPAPSIQFDKTHHDFGRLHQSQKATHRYKVTNVGTAPLEIKRITPACGCSYTVAGQWLLKPQESTYIEVGFDPAGLHGSVHKVVDVTSNDPVSPKTRLSFEASVMKDIMPSASHVNFSNIPRNGKASSDIRLKSGSSRPIEIKSALIPGVPFLSCTPQKDGMDVLLTIAFDASLVPQKTYKGRETLTVLTTSRSEPRMQISIHWDLEAVIEAIPGKIHFSGSPGKEMRATLQLTSASGRPFRILSAKPTSALIKVAGIGGRPAPQHQLEVILSSKPDTRALFETIALTLDDPDQSELEIGITAKLM